MLSFSWHYEFLEEREYLNCTHFLLIWERYTHLIATQILVLFTSPKMLICPASIAFLWIPRSCGQLGHGRRSMYEKVGRYRQERDENTSGPWALTLEICILQEVALEVPQVPGPRFSTQQSCARPIIDMHPQRCTKWNKHFLSVPDIHTIPHLFGPVEHYIGFFRK